MKAIFERLVAIATLSVAFVVVSQPLQSLAQTPAASPHESRVAARKANHLLERKVINALSKGNVDTADISVVAKHGEILLGGEVTYPADVDRAATIAGQVPGVNAVKNYLTVFEPGGG